MDTNKLKEKYEKEIRPSLIKELGYKNYLEAPSLVKIVLNVGIGKEGGDNKIIDAATRDIKAITGQTPSLRRARKAIAGFKLREGQPIGLMVTLRGQKLYDFLEKLTRIVFPRMRDFRGLSTQGFDHQGNFSLGFSEQVVFPEIDVSTIDKNRGLEVTLVTTAKTDSEAQKLLELLGFKFREGKERTH